MTLEEGSSIILPLQDKFPPLIKFFTREREIFKWVSCSVINLSIRHFVWLDEHVNVRWTGSDIVINNTTQNHKITYNKEKVMPVPSLKLIKLATIIMGVLIILGIIALIYGVHQKLSEFTGNLSEQTIFLKPGQIIRSVTTDAAGGILLWIYQPSELEQKQLIMHIDKSGTVKSHFHIITE